MKKIGNIISHFFIELGECNPIYKLSVMGVAFSSAWIALWDQTPEHVKIYAWGISALAIFCAGVSKLTSRAD